MDLWCPPSLLTKKWGARGRWKVVPEFRNPDNDVI